MKICLVASRGGHLEELRFAQQLDATTFLITEKSYDIAAEWGNIYCVEPINRKEFLAIWKIVKLFVVASKIIKKKNQIILFLRER